MALEEDGPVRGIVSRWRAVYAAEGRHPPRLDPGVCNDCKRDVEDRAWAVVDNQTYWPVCRDCLTGYSPESRATLDLPEPKDWPS